MFAEARERRELQNKIEEARKLEAPQLKWGEPDFDSASEEFLQARRKVHMAEHRLDLFETEVLRALALKYGVEEPTEAGSWNDDSESGVSPEDVTYWLSRRGQARLRASIREQQRKNWQFWITVITALTGLGGTLIGIIAALKD
jgi:hypothetical protein